jgi:hypothetical protein
MLGGASEICSLHRLKFKAKYTFELQTSIYKLTFRNKLNETKFAKKFTGLLCAEMRSMAPHFVVMAKV